MFRRNHPLFEEAKDPPGGGGAPAAPFTDDQLAIIGQTVNAAITSHLKRQPALADQLKDFDWKAMLAPVVTELVPKPDEGGGEGDKSKPAKGKQGADDPVARQLQDLAAKLEASEKKAQALEQARLDAENARNHERATNELRNGLAQKVRPELLDMLVENLAVSRKQLKVGDSGSATLTVKRAPYKGAPEEDQDLPLSEAIPIFLASEQAKIFLPAPGGDNTNVKGSRAPRVPPNGGGGELPADPAARTLKQLEDQGIDPSELFD